MRNDRYVNILKLVEAFNDWYEGDAYQLVKHPSTDVFYTVIHKSHTCVNEVERYRAADTIFAVAGSEITFRKHRDLLNEYAEHFKYYGFNVSSMNEIPWTSGC